MEVFDPKEPPLKLGSSTIFPMYDSFLTIMGFSGSPFGLQWLPHIASLPEERTRFCAAKLHLGRESLPPGAMFFFGVSVVQICLIKKTSSVQINKVIKITTCKGLIYKAWLSCHDVN